MTLKDAIQALKAAGVRFLVPGQDHYSVPTAAQKLDCSATWIKEHPEQFPNMWRMPGGELRIPASDVTSVEQRRQLGELRIPAKDLDALAERNRIRRSA